MSELYNEVLSELREDIFPFWTKLYDARNDRFCGYVSAEYERDWDAPLGGILFSRMLWFYSNYFLTTGDEKALFFAGKVYNTLVTDFLDEQYGGIYWSVTADKQPLETTKHIYCQAFFIYALASYYDACREQSVLGLALRVFEQVEREGKDVSGYREELSREWQALSSSKYVTGGNPNVQRTMNTTLHLTEAYTELYRVSADWRVKHRLAYLLDLTYNKIYDKQNGRLNVFFDKDWNVVGDVHSYGHDIEASWLLDRALDILGSEYPEEKARLIIDMNFAIAENVAAVGFDYGDGALNNERDGEHVDKTRVWWVEAEAVVGFVNAYQRYGGERYYQLAVRTWDYIKARLIDPRGEWRSQIEADGSPTVKPVVEPWKCPYHNGRMCLELVSRLTNN